MLPGDVYYYSSNSFVLCVQQNSEKEELNEAQVSPKTAGLNPNATVFLSNKQCSPTETPNWDGVYANGYQFANGDVSLTEVGGSLPTSDSPLANTLLPDEVDNQVAFPNSDSSIVSTTEDEENLDGSVDEDGIRQLLKNQLEVCFSRDNLASDTYLQSQMDADQYLPITTIASLQQIQQLSNDLQLIVQLLRESASVQVDEKGEKVRPNHNRCIVILREIPDTTPVEEVQGLFSGENCPKFVSCEFAHNNNWYVTFDSDADAQKAYQYLREEVRNFLGKPIMARIKAKPLIRMTYPRNGYRNRYAQQQQPQQSQQQQQPQTQVQANTQSIPQVHQQSSQSENQQTLTTMTSQPFTTQQPSSVPLMSNVPPYINSHPLPFFAPNPLLSQWPTSPTLLDPSMVLAMNGYQPTSIKLNTTAPRHQQYSNINRNSRNTRPNRPSNQERMDNRSSYDRSREVNHNRTSPRNHDNVQMSPSPHPIRGRSEIHSHNHSSVQQPVLDHNSNVSSRQSDSLPPAQRGYRSRRRREEDGAPRIPRQMPSKEKPTAEAQFDLEINSFPPLPGPMPSNSSSSNSEVFESKLSDVVKGTAKPQARENTIKPQVSPPVQQPVTTSVQPSEPVGVPATPRSPPPSQPHNDNSSNNSNSALNGISVASPTDDSSSGSIPAPVPSPPAVSPQKPQKVSIPEATVNSIESHPIPVAKPPCTNQVKSQVSVEKNSSVKLSYAQMVQRGRDSDSAAESKNNSDSDSEFVQQNGSRPTLKEQSQAKASTARSSKDSPRKDSEPKDQRHFTGRRSKENRERRERRRSERENSKSSTK